MRRYVSWLGMLCIVLALTDCGPGRRLPRPPGAPDNIWDDFPNTVLEVYGTDPGTSGQLVYQALKKQPELTGFFAALPEPDAIYVIGRAWIHKRFEIYFKRGPGAPFEIALDRTKEGYVPSARRPYTPGTDAADVSTPAPAPDPTPEPVRSPTRTKRPSASQTAAAPATPKVPSATQKIECPVQPSRADCKSFCPGTWSWCK